MINVFRRKPRPENQAIFSHRQEGAALHLQLVRDSKPLPIETWVAERPDAAGVLGELLSQAEDAVATAQDPPVLTLRNDLILSPRCVAELDAASALLLSLPSPTALALDLKPIGRIDEDEFRIDTRWVKPGGQPCRVSIEGALITCDGVKRRIPEPLYSLMSVSGALRSPVDKAERFHQLALLRRHWPEDGSAAITSEPYLRDMRVHYASSLSLSLRTLTPERTDFDPVLFGRGVADDAEVEGRALDEVFDNVLTPAAQKLFAEDRFRREANVRPVYVLKDGEYVFIDPSLRPALGVVRQLQDRPESVRREFVLNPRKALKEALGEAVADEIALDELFVETEQFSSRVAGVDVWRKPVLAWITPVAKNSWLPERFGLRIGDDYFEIPIQNISAVLAKAAAAVEGGDATIPVEGLLKSATDDGPPPPKSLPVTNQLITALESFRPFAVAQTAEMDHDGDGPPPDWNAALNGKLFLVVRENFEEVEFASIQDDVAPPAASPLRLPERLGSRLKPHQVDGLQWLVRSLETGHPGALLADDMGLGKTLQAIAFMAWLQEEGLAGRQPRDPFLIVAPTGLLGTWRSEIEKHLTGQRLGQLVPAFGSDLKLLKEQDSFGLRDIETGRAALKAEAWRDAGVVLTTYETLRDYHFSFARTRFGLIVYDEIQKLKNPASQMTRAAKTLNGAFTLGMTGTPVENRLQDLWSIMDVIAPGLLGASRDFERRHPAHDPPALARLKAQLTEAETGRAPYMLRRLKSDALKDMPTKSVHPFEGEMPAVQAQAYKDLVVRAAAANATSAVGRSNMLTTLAALRGISLHPLDPRNATADLEAYASQSARLSRTLEILKGVAEKQEKALIFVEDLAMQERLAGMIQGRFKLPRLPMRINGSVPGPRRQEMVERFQAAPGVFDVMILSPKAGGVGLTLTEANHVIHLSRWWNPAVEDQATDRVFRIGQRRGVHVHLPMAVHPDPSIRDSSFDLRLNALIERKRNLTRDLFLPPDVDDGELADLFREVSLGETQDVAEPAADNTAIAPEPLTESSVAEAAAEPPSSTEAESPRRTLSLPHALVSTGIKQWRVNAGSARPTSEILSLFAGKDVVEISIRDPYALSRRNNREAQVRFIEDLKAVVRSLESVTIEYAEEVDGDGSDAQNRREIGDLLSRRLSPMPRLTLSRRRKRSRDDDFHDRFVDLQIRHAGGAVKLHELSLGRGLEALYDDRKQCTVTYAPPGS